MTIDDAQKKIINAIQPIYDKDESGNIAALLLEYITKLSRIEIIIKKNENLSTSQVKFLNQAIERLQTHEPVQYITHEAWFAGMKFYVERNVLIPRPETEELVDWISKEAGNKTAGIRILDIGTGSGCIAIALKKNLPASEVWACDVSEEALNIARLNADSLHAAIDFVLVDFLDEKQHPQLPRVDIIVSNPPYIPQRQKAEMRKNVADYEPPAALFVTDENPLLFYRTIADFGKEKLNPDGRIYVEIHEDFGAEVKDLFYLKGYRSIQLKKDLQGKTRMAKISP